MIVMIGGLLIVKSQILMILRHYCANCYVYSIVIDYHHGTMGPCHHLHHHHQDHHSTPMVGYPTQLAHESGHVSNNDHGYLEVCHSDQI
jgi:hypothetical protein